MINYENLHKTNQPFEEAFKQKFEGFLQNGWYILGNEVETFEQNFASYCQAKYCVGVANGLDALELGLQVFNFPKNAEIIVSSNTYIATILAIVNQGFKPVLVEPTRSTYTIDPSKIEEKITSATKAIMVVHLYGRVAEMDKIVALAEKYNLEIIEDCAQAHGANLNGKMAGTFGKIGAYSFYPTKNLGALGDAGAIITSDEKIYRQLKALRNYGSEKKYHNLYIGKNSRLDELQAAFLNVKLPFLNKINTHKIELAKLYDKGLTDKVIKPIFADNYSHVFHIYNIRTEKREALKEYLVKNEIQTEIHYPVAPHLQKGYSHLFENQEYIISEEIHNTTLSLPISYATTKEEVKNIIDKINTFFE